MSAKMAERSFPLTAVVYGCLTGDLKSKYDEATKDKDQPDTADKFCDMVLPSPESLGEHGELQHRIIVAKKVALTDGEQEECIGFATACKYLMPYLGNEHSERAVETMYMYADLLHAKTAEDAAENGKILEQMEILFEFDDDMDVVLAGDSYEDCVTIWTRRP